MTSEVRGKHKLVRLDFNTHVLGRRAAARLRARQVTQTIRSANSSVAQALQDSKLHLADPVEVMLDGNIFGIAVLVSVDKLSLDKLTSSDAARSGFDGQNDLLMALKRAGFRFRRPDQYHALRLRFDWRDGAGVPAKILPPPQTDGANVVLASGEN